MKVVNFTNHVLTEKEKNELIELHYQVAKLSFPNKNVELDYSKRRIEELNDFLSINKAVLFVAKDKNKIVGFAWCYLHEFFDETRLFINILSINKDYQKQGIGKLLVNSVEDYARRKNIGVIDVIASCQNINSNGFYKHLGFIESRIHYVKSI